MIALRAYLENFFILEHYKKSGLRLNVICKYSSMLISIKSFRHY